MILDTDQILEYIKSPQNSDLPTFRDDHSTFDLYFNGGDVASEIERITSYENAKQKDLRSNIARSPKDLIGRLLKPFHKVFSASGGSQVFDFNTEAQGDDFKAVINKLPEGISLNKWMEDYWVEAYVTDPNAVILIEAEVDGDERAYPTYKSINVIHDYTSMWGKLDYLILKYGTYILDGDTQQQVEVFRVIDDAIDGLFYIKNEELMPFENEEVGVSYIVHNKGFVPAVIVSDIVDKKTSGRRSFLSKIDDLLKEYLRESSVLSIFKFLHAYPKYWQYASKCVKCDGTGKIVDPSDETLKVTCTSCGGKRLNLNIDVSDGVLLPLPHNDQPVIAPNVMGFATPPIDAWEKMEQSIDRLEKKMEFAIIGTHVEEQKSNTATGRFIDHQPVDTALHSFSETEENIMDRVADYMAKWMYGDEYGKVTIKNGKRFIFEHPDTLWAKYVDARDRKSPVSTLDYLYKEYLRSEYINDEPMFEQKLKEFYIEPMVHYTIEQLDGLSSTNMSVKIQEKLYFSDWLSETTDFTRDLETLKEEFETYLSTKNLVNETTTKIEGDDESGEGDTDGYPGGQEADS